MFIEGGETALDRASKCLVIGSDKLQKLTAAARMSAAGGNQHLYRVAWSDEARRFPLVDDRKANDIHVMNPSTPIISWQHDTGLEDCGCPEPHGTWNARHTMQCKGETALETVKPTIRSMAEELYHTSLPVLPMHVEVSFRWR